MHMTHKSYFAMLCLAGATLSAQAANVSVKAMGTITGPNSGVFKVTTNVTFHASNTYLLDGVILIEDGAAVTIEAGTLIRGQNEYTTNKDYRPGMLVIKRGGKIYANGTAANPIIMTDEWDNNVPNMTPGSVTRTWKYSEGGAAATLRTNSYNYAQLGGHHGAWGGLMVCGRAFVSWDGGAPNTTLGGATIPAEGLDVGLDVYGGGRNDDDSSGVIKYLQIRYGGSVLASGKEVNGLTMYGVGRGTELHHVEVFNNQDDMFEWFGGTVNGKYLVAHGAGDDIFDSDAGYRGKNQFLFGVQRNLGGKNRESGCSDKGMEMDGYEKEPGNGDYLFTASAWYNLTLVGWGEPSPGNVQKNVAIQMRDNASPQINNSIFMDFGCYGTFIENRTDNSPNLNSTYRFGITNGTASLPADTATNYLGETIGAAYLYKAQRPGMQAHIKDCIFWNIIDSAGATGALYPAGTDTALNTLFNTASGGGSGPYFTAGLGSYSGWTNATHNNVTDIYSDGTDYMPIAARSRSLVVNRSPYSTSNKGFDVTYIDPRAAMDAVHGVTPVLSDGWLTPAAYRGAFDPYNNWARGWTMMDRIGLFGAAQTVTETEAGIAITAFTVASPIAYFNTEAGVVYRVKAATTVDGTYSTIAELTGTGSQVSYLDVGANDPAKFYKVYVVSQN